MILILSTVLTFISLTGVFCLSSARADLPQTVNRAHKSDRQPIVCIANEYTGECVQPRALPGASR
jgi:hypothetical protein